MYGLFQWFVKITALIPQIFFFNPKVYYEDKSVQSRKIKGKAIVMPNHHTIMDVGVMMFTFWTRTLRCLMAELLYKKNFFMSTFIKCLGGIKVNRDSHDMSVLSRCKKILDKGGVVEFYPEGRLAKEGEEKPLEFKPGVVVLALETNAPIIPVYHNGNHMKKGRCKVMIGKPIMVREYYDDNLSEKENINNICCMLRQKVIDLGNLLQEQDNCKG